MECRTFVLILHSAKGLPDVEEFGRMKVYAKVSISGESESELVTPVDSEGETSPSWNCRFTYTVAEEAVQLEERRVNVAIKFYCQKLQGDSYVGEVNLNLKRLFNYTQSRENLWLDVDRFGEEGTFGKLIFSYQFGEKIIIKKRSRIGRKILKGAFMLSKVGFEIVKVVFF